MSLKSLWAMLIHTSLIGATACIGGCWRVDSVSLDSPDDDTETTSSDADGDADADGDVDTDCGDEDWELSWAKQTTGGAEEQIAGGAVLPAGQVLVAGWVSGSPSDAEEYAVFGAGEPTETSLSSGVFVARYHADGTLEQARTVASLEEDNFFGLVCCAMAALPDGSTVVTGDLDAATVFGPGDPGETELVPSGEGGDIYVARFDSAGTITWVRQASGDGDDESHGIAFAADGSAVVCGSFKSPSITFGEDEPNETQLYNLGDRDIFIARYLPDGTLAWARHAGGATGYDACKGLAVLADGGIMITGQFRAEATFGDGEPGETTLSGGWTGSRILVARYEADGDFAWARSPGRGNGNGIVALSDGSALVAGEFRGTATFGGDEADGIVLEAHGDDDMFVARYTTDGEIGWARAAGGVDNDYCGSLALSHESTVLVSGVVRCDATFGQGEPDECSIEASGKDDGVVFELSLADGALIDVTHFSDPEHRMFPVAIDISEAGSLILAGGYEGQVVFGKGTESETLLTTEENEFGNVFVVSYQL